MAVTPYRAVEFKRDDVITKTTLDQVQSNMQWINDNTPRGRFVRHNDEILDEKLVILAGRKRVRRMPKKDMANAKVRFGRAFSPRCSPHVTTSVVAEKQRRIFCIVNGPGGRLTVNSEGFEIKVNVAAEKKKNDKIKEPIWVHWHAFGYRTDDMDEF